MKNESPEGFFRPFLICQWFLSVASGKKQKTNIPSQIRFPFSVFRGNWKKLDALLLSPRVTFSQHGGTTTYIASFFRCSNVSTPGMRDVEIYNSTGTPCIRWRLLNPLPLSSGYTRQMLSNTFVMVWIFFLGGGEALLLRELKFKVTLLWKNNLNLGYLILYLSEWILFWKFLSKIRHPIVIWTLYLVN